MPYPRTPQQAGHAPICQQCHEDARDPGTLSADGTTGDAAGIGGPLGGVRNVDGVDLTANPRFAGFPHETTNANMTIETGDALCLNCHPVSQLP